MAVEYETTPSTPGNPNPAAMFPLTGSSVKKRVMKHSNQENFRASVFFCGKRKRPHRDRYHDYDHYRLHSSSVPRQREFFTPKNSYLEYKNRNRNAYAKPCERILPLNKNIVSKIEKISQESLNNSNAIGFSSGVVTANEESNISTGFHFDSAYLKSGQVTQKNPAENPHEPLNETLTQAANILQVTAAFQAKSLSIDDPSIASANKMSQKSGSFDSPFSVQGNNLPFVVQPPAPDVSTVSLPIKIGKDSSRKNHTTSRHSNHKRKQSKRSHLKMQFSEQNGMDCGNLNDFLSSSSLSSSDSEAGETNESDREGDDELTDWPGNEAMVNFASKNDFKRAKPARLNNSIGSLNKPFSLHARYASDDCMAQDEDTLMSADELPSPRTSFENTTDPNLFPSKFSAIMQNRLTSNESQTHSAPSTSDNLLATNSSRVLRNTTSLPIDIVPQGPQQFASGMHKTQIESDMSGEASNILSSPNLEVREIRAGCRRIRDERPGFTIFSSVNEHLSRFVLDDYFFEKKKKNSFIFCLLQLQVPAGLATISTNFTVYE